MTTPDPNTTPDEDWSVQDLTPEELAQMSADGGLGSCMDDEQAGLGDDDHGLEVGADGSTDQS